MIGEELAALVIPLFLRRYTTTAPANDSELVQTTQARLAEAAEAKRGENGKVTTEAESSSYGQQHAATPLPRAAKRSGFIGGADPIEDMEGFMTPCAPRLTKQQSNSTH